MFIVRIANTAICSGGAASGVCRCRSSGTRESDASHIYKHCAPPEQEETYVETLAVTSQTLTTILFL